MKTKWQRWLIIVILIAGVCSGVAIWNFSRKVDAVTKVLNQYWNPYGNPPEYIAKYPYAKTARRFVVYIFLNNPSEDELADHICGIEHDWLLVPRKERAKTVARLVLAAYHQDKVPSSAQSPKQDAEGQDSHKHAAGNPPQE